MANFVCFLAGRRAMLGEEVRAAGLAAAGAPLRVYASAGTHTWIQKACDLFGLGTDAIRWIPTDAAQRLQAGRAPDADCRRPGARGPADAGGGHRRQREHRRRRSDPRALRHLPRPWPLASRGRRLRRAGRRAARRAGRSARAGPGRLARGRPAQVALRAARGRVRAGARAAAPERDLRLPPGVLPLRDRGRRAADQLPRARPPEQPRLPRAQGLARAPPGGPRGLRPDDRRRLPARRGAPRAREPASRARGGRL